MYVLFLLGAWFYSCHRFVGTCMLLYFLILIHYRSVFCKLYFICSTVCLFCLQRTLFEGRPSHEQFQKPLDQISAKENFEETVFFRNMPANSWFILQSGQASIEISKKQTRCGWWTNPGNQLPLFQWRWCLGSWLNSAGGSEHWAVMVVMICFPQRTVGLEEESGVIWCNHRMWNYVRWFS